MKAKRVETLTCGEPKLKYLAWDSGQLGVRCGLIECFAVDSMASLEAISSKIQAKKNKFDFITIKLSGNCVDTVNSLIRTGAHLVDTELTFIYLGKTCRNQANNHISSIDNLRLNFYGKCDSEAFIPLAKEMKHSRFFRDPLIPKEKALRLWETSIKNHCAGFADQLVIALCAGVPCGLSALKFKGQARIYLHIVGVLRKYQGKGIGRRMLQAITERYGDKYTLCVETQADNRAAQSVYRAAGFRYRDLRYVLHYWRNSKKGSICE